MQRAERTVAGNDARPTMAAVTARSEIKEFAKQICNIRESLIRDLFCSNQD